MYGNRLTERRLSDARAAETLLFPVPKHRDRTGCARAGDQGGWQRRRYRREHANHDAFPHREPEVVRC